MTESTQGQGRHLPVDMHGAVSLDQTSSSACGAGRQAPDDAVRAALVVDLTEQNFAETIERSAHTPLLLALVSGTGQDDALVDTLTDLTVARRGRLLLAIADASRHPQIARALQARALPTTLAVIAGQPIPLFEGMPAAAQIEPVIDQVLQLAAQQGIIEVVDVPEEAPAEDAAPTLTPEQQAAQDALDQGRPAEAEQRFQRILDTTPKDAIAHHGLLLAQLVQRVEAHEAQADAADPVDRALAEADRLWLGGDAAASFDRLLRPELWGDPGRRGDLQARLIALFDLTGNGEPAVNAARTRMASLLF